VAAFATYAEAEHAVDLLAERRFPIDRVAIVGRGLVFMEVGGRLGDRLAQQVLSHGRPDLLASGEVRAASFEVLADEAVADEAVRLLTTDDR
jgi:hypothetical protein